MSQHRIHLFGASGSGTSTLGRVLADKLSIRHFDADDYYWQKTDPPYTLKHPPDVRVRTLLGDMARAQEWVLSGSVVSWGDVFIPLFSLAVFVTLPRGLRLQRLAHRERARYGARIEKGGDRYEASQAFLEWAAQYDTAEPPIRSRLMHEQWITRLTCPVVRIESLWPPEELASNLLQRLEPGGSWGSGL